MKEELNPAIFKCYIITSHLETIEIISAPDRDRSFLRSGFVIKSCCMLSADSFSNVTPLIESNDFSMTLINTSPHFHGLSVLLSLAH